MSPAARSGGRPGPGGVRPGRIRWSSATRGHAACAAGTLETVQGARGRREVRLSRRTSAAPAYPRTGPPKDGVPADGGLRRTARHGSPNRCGKRRPGTPYRSATRPANAPAGWSDRGEAAGELGGGRAGVLGLGDRPDHHDPAHAVHQHLVEVVQVDAADAEPRPVRVQGRRVLEQGRARGRTARLGGCGPDRAAAEVVDALLPAAAVASSAEWVDRPMMMSSPRIRRATSTGRSPWPRWSTSGRAAKATSARSLTASSLPCRSQAVAEDLEQLQLLARPQGPSPGAGRCRRRSPGPRRGTPPGHPGRAGRRCRGTGGRQKARAWARRFTSVCRPAAIASTGEPGRESSAVNSQRSDSISS